MRSIVFCFSLIGLGVWALWPMRLNARSKLGAMVLAAAFAIYGVLGGYKQVIADEGLQREAAHLAEQMQTPEGLDLLLSQLKQRANEQPDDVQAWYWLGRIYMRSGQLKEAREALAHAYVLAPKISLVVYHYALALIAENQGQINKESKGLLLKLKQDPSFAKIVDQWLQHASGQSGAQEKNSSDDGG